MKIQIIGVGIIGEAQAYLASKLGHEVLGVDSAKSTSLYARMVKNIEKDVDITFICTPESAAEGVVEELVHQNVKGLYVIRSSVPPMTTQRLMEKYGVHLCHNPEFLRVKTAFDDIIHPNFVLIGQCCPEHGDILKKFYLSTEHPVLVTEPTISETVKITLNSYLATLVAFWNEIDELTGSMGVNTEEVARIARFDPRVSSYGTEFFGVPFGGTCLPKDIKQLIQACLQGGVSPQLLEAVRDSNQAIKDSNNEQKVVSV
jgi:nucleotide sugar dehydrogenase